MKKKPGRFQIAVNALTAAISGTVVSTSYANCTMFSTMPTQCPLCQQTVPANVTHSCSKSARKKTRR